MRTLPAHIKHDSTHCCFVAFGYSDAAPEEHSGAFSSWQYEFSFCFRASLTLQLGGDAAWRDGGLLKLVFLVGNSEAFFLAHHVPFTGDDRRPYGNLAGGKLVVSSSQGQTHCLGTTALLSMICCGRTEPGGGDGCSGEKRGTNMLKHIFRKAKIFFWVFYRWFYQKLFMFFFFAEITIKEQCLKSHVTTQLISYNL